MRANHLLRVWLISWLCLGGCRLLPSDATPTVEITDVVTPPPVSTARPILNGWALSDPIDATLPEIFQKTETGYRLQTDWPVASIGYVYRWWGLGDPVFDWQEIKLENDVYRKQGEIVAPEAVQALLDALIELHPTQSLVSANTHTDDYPSWVVELKGKDGQHILISSSSNAELSAPWNVLYNGRLFGQYTGAIAEPLSKLFSGVRGEPAGAFYPGGGEEGKLTFFSVGLPPQLNYGFFGLLPIADSFSYYANPKTNRIEGYIEGRNSIAGFGNMVIGTINSLISVSITSTNGTTLNCPIETLPTSDPVGAEWAFNCPFEHAMTGPYRYPIQIKFGTDDGQGFVATGELVGRWRDKASLVILPLPLELKQALISSVEAQDLFTDHVILFANYSGEIQAQAGPAAGTLTGELIMVGQKDIGGGYLPYSIGTPFTVQDGQLLVWQLSRAKLEAMLANIVSLPLTQRALTLDANAILNLWYAEDSAESKAQGESYRSRAYRVTLAPCVNVVGEGDYPRPNEPLQAFSFNEGFNFWFPQFVMINGQPVVSSLRWAGEANDSRNPLFPMPSIFEIKDTAPLESVSFDRDYFNKPQLTLNFPEDATPRDIEAYAVMADKLPQPADKEYSSFWDVENVALAVTNQGEFEVVNCKP